MRTWTPLEVYLGANVYIIHLHEHKIHSTVDKSGT